MVVCTVTGVLDGAVVGALIGVFDGAVVGVLTGALVVGTVTGALDGNCVLLHPWNWCCLSVGCLGFHSVCEVGVRWWCVGIDGGALVLMVVVGIFGG
jgi:hypothetical protein